MKVTFLKTACFDHWQVSFSAIQRIGLILYRFSIADYKTGSQYQHPDVYLTETKAYLSAYFLCLRASLDREQRPALLIDLETGCILSSNLPALELLTIDATGASIADFILDETQQRSELQQGQTKASPQSMVLCNADGLPIKCEVQVKVAPYCSQWAIFYFNARI